MAGQGQTAPQHGMAAAPVPGIKLGCCCHLAAATRAAPHAVQLWCELLCWCHLAWGSVLMYMKAWDAELVDSMQQRPGLSMTAWLTAGGPAAPPTPTCCPVEEQQLCYAGVQAGSIAAVALQGMCRIGISRVKNPQSPSKRAFPDHHQNVSHVTSCGYDFQ